MNKVLATALFTGAALLGFSSIASAYEPGWYLGGQLGWTKQYIAQIDTSNVASSNSNISTILATSSSSSNSGLGGSAFGGYMFNNYFGGEFGYIYFHNVTASSTVYGQSAATATTLATPQNAGVSSISKMQDLDMLVKGMFPFGDSGFDIYAKAGMAAVFSKVQASAFTTRTSDSGVVTIAGASVSNNHNPIRPAYGLGLGYDINDCWTTNINWLRVQGAGNTVPAANEATIGFEYYFGV